MSFRATNFFHNFKDHRLESNESRIMHIHGQESKKKCIIECYKNRTSCKSVNYRKNTTSAEGPNCELLNTSYSEEPRTNLKKNTSFDHYKLVKSDEVSIYLFLTAYVRLTNNPKLSKYNCSKIDRDRNLINQV